LIGSRAALMRDLNLSILKNEIVADAGRVLEYNGFIKTFKYIHKYDKD
jgi:hypothetical protein